jgi:hypothetical protein
MEENKPQGEKNYSADWFFHGVLARLGETVDKFAGRKSEPPNSLATSGLVERLKPLLEQEKVFVEGKGFVVPHRINLKMQWDKFSADGAASLDSLSESLTIAAIDHINDSLYYTYAPVKVEINSDYFTEGVKLTASFAEFAGEVSDAEHDVTMPNIVIPDDTISPAAHEDQSSTIFVSAVVKLKDTEMRKELALEPNRSISVGRTGSNQLVIDDPSVSKVHASLVSDAGGSLSVADTGSTNGTLVAGERIPYGKAVPVPFGARVTFGTVQVTFDIKNRVATGETKIQRPAGALIGQDADNPLPDKDSAENLNA